ncbi:MAG TPA: cation:proton antiporter [Caulobacterales bacterium]|nr:cation:proton antiporter [Caulobacterales bacterium]
MGSSMPHQGMATSEVFLIAMIIIFTVPYLVWRILKLDYYAPLVVVQIVGGILLGPGILGAAYPAYYDFVFTPQVVAALNGIAWWAVMIFVFVAGIELDLKKAWAHRSETSVTAGLALGTPLLFGCIAALGLLYANTMWGAAAAGDWIGDKGRTWQFVLGVGMACAVTALPILVLLMEKMQILRTPLGQRTLRYASLDDIAIWAVLALILLDWERVGRQAGFLCAFALVAMGVRRLMRVIAESDRWYAALIWLAACSFAADWCGLHFMVGAFLAGAALDSDLFDRKRMDLFRGHVLLAIMPVFFLSTGLRTSWEMGGLAVFACAGVLLAASVAGKLLGVHIAGKLLKWQKGEANVIGWLLQTKALIMIIFVSILLDKHIISSQAFTALLLMAVASTMLTAPQVAPRLEKMRELIFKEAAVDLRAGADPAPGARNEGAAS